MSAAHNSPVAGLFATARKGALTSAEVHEIAAHRARARPTPWSALARQYGRCEADIRAHFIPVTE